MAHRATHENGTTWQFGIAINKKRGDDHARAMMGNAVRNYCRKHRIPGTITISNPENGETFEVIVCSHYTMQVVA